MKHEQILVNLRKIIRSVNLEGKRIEKEHGVSIPQLLCLNFLNSRPNFTASHKDIKDFIQLNASTVTGIVSRLEMKGFVARLPKKEDRRVGLVVLTAKGAKLLAITPDPLHEQLSARLKQLSPEELLALQHAFDKIINFLDVENVDAAPILTSDAEIDPQE
ncbi:MAG: MarR family transcriptional regulator [Saprospiraceae bacterium]|nr:MarR family transcriptional regulator [Lewinella sp.]